MDCGRLAISLTRALTGSGVAAVVCYATSRILTPLAVGSGVVGLKTSALITILASFGLGMVAYVACSWLLRSDEVAEIQALIRRRRQQSAPVNDPAVP
jgi:hypothetical protein